MSEQMREIMYKSSVEHLASLERMVAGTTPSQMLQTMITDAKAKVVQFAPPAAVAPPSPPAAPGAAKQPATLEEWAKGVEQRLIDLEGIVKTVAAPALNEAAQAGAAIMGALGKGMSDEQVAWVQQRVEKSPEFFASPGCKAAIDIFINEWQTFEGAPK